MKRYPTSLYLLIALTVVYIVFELVKPKPIDWKPSFMNKDKIPYGTYITFDLLSDIFPKQKTEVVRLPVYNQLDEEDDYDSTQLRNYLFINDYFVCDENDLQSLMDFVYNGNSVFISAENISNKLLDTLKLDMDRNVLVKSDSMKTGFTNRELQPEEKFTYLKLALNNYFSGIDSSGATVLGVDEKNNPNFICIHHGEGNFYLNTIPQAFSNFYMVKNNNAEYAVKALSYLPVQPLWWDEYTKQGRIGEDDFLRVIMSKEALRWAYYIALLGIFVYIIFEGKRTQRIIPIVEPLRNTSLDFTKTIGSLYFQKKDHSNIAQKKITYFLENIRSRYFEKTNEIDEEFISKIAARSGASVETTTELFNTIQSFREKKSVSEQELIHLNNLIENFNKQANN